MPAAIVIGGDGYLYIVSKSKLFRIRIKDKAVGLPTNMVSRPPKSL